MSRCWIGVWRGKEVSIISCIVRMKGLPVVATMGKACYVLINNYYPALFFREEIVWSRQKLHAHRRSKTILH
jgi:hypothetical protein